MARYCEVCGRTLKTGRKYCYEHRGTRGPNSGQWIIAIGLIAFALCLGFAFNPQNVLLFGVSFVVVLGLLIGIPFLLIYYIKPKTNLKLSNKVIFFISFVLIFITIFLAPLYHWLLILPLILILAVILLFLKYRKTNSD